MPRTPTGPEWAKSTGELVLAWNPDGEEESLPRDATRVPGGFPSLLDRTVEPLAGHPREPCEYDVDEAPIDFSGELDPILRSSSVPEGPDGPRRSQAPDAPIPFPHIGEYFAGFLIRSELGRGAFGRVYLAEQSGLANRPVALKVSRLLGEEPRNLARLQHTHIVPIHSVHDDPITGLRLLCMPYVGGANLAQILEHLGSESAIHGTGRTFLQALDRLAASRGPLASRGAKLKGIPPRSELPDFEPPSALENDVSEIPSGTSSFFHESLRRYLSRLSIAPADSPPVASSEGKEARSEQPARQFLRGSTYLQAAVWVIARLAEALEHAHDRGLLHRDLKPSNILIAGDGTPMLLDFNLSADVTRESSPEEARALLGGTLPYMSPEHLDAFNPVGITMAAEVDERSDLYSLGLILFEMITGNTAFEDPPASLPLVDIVTMMTYQRRTAPPSARAVNPRVSWSLESVVQKCLEPDPEQRYQHAGELAEDLRRLIDDRPLRFAPELSVREVAAKWIRRHPGTTSTTTVGMLSLGLIMGLGASVWGLRDHVDTLAARSEREAFSKAFRGCQLRLNTVSGPTSHVGPGLREARKALRRYEVLTRPDWTAGPLVARLQPHERETLLAEMSELLYLTGRAEICRAEQSGRPSELRPALADAVHLLDCAERFDPAPSAALYADRAWALEKLGRADRAKRDEARAESLPPKSARDFYLSGTGRLVRGHLEESERDLQHAVAIDPRRFWAWFTLGLCHHQQGRFVEAAGDFAVCTSLFPEFAWPHLNRGLALAAAGRVAEARFEYDRALELSPNFLEALVNRGLASLDGGDAPAAFADLDRAMQLGHRDSAVRAARAEALALMGRRDEARAELDAAVDAAPGEASIRVARGFFRLVADPDGARADFLDALALDPGNARAHLGLANLWRSTQPRAALRALDRALACDPNSLGALTLRALTRALLGDPEAESDVDRLIQTPTAHSFYNAACALSLLSKSIAEPRYKTRSLDLLRRALALGFPADTARSDPDLDPVRDRSDFAAILPDPKPSDSSQ